MKHVSLGEIGYHCQLIMVFSELDIVAVTTARDFCPLGRLSDLTAPSAVKSEAALAPDTEGTARLAEEIREVANEQPTPVGAVPEAAVALAAKTYEFPRNVMNIKSLALTSTAPSSHLELQTFDRGGPPPGAGFSIPIGPPGTEFSIPIGLDGLYRTVKSSDGEVQALRGAWRDDHTFVIDRLLVGWGQPPERWTSLSTATSSMRAANSRGATWFPSSARAAAR